ncbi:MAG: C1 family peptidase, partial [bacterium]
DFSRLFVYYNGRDKGGYTNEDKGSAICYCVESMMDKGVCLESTWGYDTTLVNTKPKSKAYVEANNYKVIVAEHFTTDLDLMKKCLAHGYPFVFGLKLYNSFQKAREKGFVPIPDNEDVLRDRHGLHAMLCVGYSDEEKCFIVRNSWGKNWGDKGYCYIPYDYMANIEHRCTDNNFLLKTISDVQINEKELVKSTGKDAGSLFNVSYDIYDLNAYKKNREKLKTEIEQLFPELDSLRQKVTRQREDVLMQQFRSDAEKKDIAKNQEEQKVLTEKIGKIDESLTQLKGERKKLIEKKKRKIFQLFIIYPVIGLLVIILLGIIPIKIWSWPDLFAFIIKNIGLVSGVFSIGIILYLVWAILKIKRQIINKLNEVQDKINEKTDLRTNVIKKLIDLYDNYFEIRRKHKLYDVYYNFVTEEMSDYVEKLRNNFNKWFDVLRLKKDHQLSDLPNKEFTDTNIVFNAISEENLKIVIEKQNIFEEYYDLGAKSMREFFFNENDKFIIEEGVEEFVKDIINSARKNHLFKQMQTVGIFDFLFDNDMLLNIFPDLVRKPLDEKIEIFVQFCSPFSKIDTSTDAIDSSELFELQFPKDDSEECKKFINEAKKKFSGSVHEYNNLNDSSSSIVFLRVKSMLPAFTFELIREGFKIFNSLDDTNKYHLHIDKDFAKYSCIPDELKKLIK